MADITSPRQNTANGTATPATLTHAGAVAGNLLICIIAAIGTSPTIATPTGDTWQVVKSTSGASVSFAMFALPNAGAGSHVPSSVLGGTVTGWICQTFEFTPCGANCAIQGSNQLASAIAQLTNVFPTTGNTLYNELFIYSVARATATIAAQNTWNVPNVSWSASQQAQAGVQGLSLDTYFASSLGQGVGQYPQASGLLGSAVNSVAIGAWFNTLASQPGNFDNVGGQAGTLVGANYQGMIGG